MERILSSQEMRYADRYTIDVLGISEETLVERAGQSVADEIIKRFIRGNVLVCIGNGNNGKDGMIIAKILKNTRSFNVTIFNVSTDDFNIFSNKYDIVVDCIFGTGLNRLVEGKYYSAIEKINSIGAYVVSCDIPSGINADNGLAMGISVKADLTVAIQEYKYGHFLNDGIDLCGELVVKDIGIVYNNKSYAHRLSSLEVKNLFKPRKRNVNKGNFAKCAIIGGSANYSGSVLLSLNALTALKTGAGYSTLVIPKSLFTVYAGKNPECLISTFTDVEGSISFNENDFIPLLKNNVIAIGMGLGVSESSYSAICYLLKNCSGTLIIDADGLNSISKYGIDILRQASCRVVLTPHVLEFARLCGKEKLDVIKNSIEYAKNFAKEYNVILVLKSSVSIITDGVQTFVNTTGCSGMAKAGSGDVLSGIICGMASLGSDLLFNVSSACYLFGASGEMAQEHSNCYALTASDIINVLPNAINTL